MDNAGFGSNIGGQSNTVAPWRFTILTGIIFFGILIIYFGLSFGYQGFLERSTAITQSKIDDLNKSPVDETSRINFLSFYSRSINVQKLLNAHITIKPVFDILESRTLPDVYFSDAKLDVAEKTLSLTGLVKDFGTLANQVYLYSHTSGISTIGISDARASEKGLSLNPKITLNPSLFIYKNLGSITNTQTSQ